MKFTRCGLDIAKTVFQVHGVNEHGVVQGRKMLRRAKLLEFFAQLPPCLIGIEACGSAHYWARELSKLGHTVKLMATQYVMAYRKRGKNDANDAEAICEAVGRPNIRFVAIKSEEQQAVLTVHRALTLVVADRTAQVNQIRGLLGEFGFLPAISPTATKAIRQTIRRWRLHCWHTVALVDVAEQINPALRGWVNYDGRFQRSALHTVFDPLDRYLEPWLRRKYKRLKYKMRRAREMLRQIRRRQPTLFAHWALAAHRWQ